MARGQGAHCTFSYPEYIEDPEKEKVAAATAARVRTGVIHFLQTHPSNIPMLDITSLYSGLNVNTILYVLLV